jgi:hypothetical protein
MGDLMKNQFLKFVPSVLIVIAIALLFIPKTVNYIDVEKFFSDTDAYYQRAEKSLFKKDVERREDYYYSGVHIGKLWKKLGLGGSFALKDAHISPLRDEYLFGCGYANYSACILPYPVIKEYELGEYRALRVSSSSVRFPDYQYLLFKDHRSSWTYFGHIDVFDNKKDEPVFKLLDNGLASVVSLAGMGDGYSTKFIQAYRLDGVSPKLLLTVPNEAHRKGLGLLGFEVTSDFNYADGFLTAHYRIAFSAEQEGAGSLPLFTAVRYLTFHWDGQELVFDASRSNADPSDVTRIVAGNYARVYTIFRTDFDKLAKADGVKKAWFRDFLSIVRDEGLPVTMPEVVSAPVSRGRASRSR